MAHLKALDLTGRAKRGIDWDNWSFPELEVLALGATDIEAIPEWVRGSVKLKKLDLHRNKITEIPGWLDGLEKLEFLNLSYNNDIRAQNIPDFLREQDVIVLIGKEIKSSGSVDSDYLEVTDARELQNREEECCNVL